MCLWQLVFLKNKKLKGQQYCTCFTKDLLDGKEHRATCLLATSQRTSCQPIQAGGNNLKNTSSMLVKCDDKCYKIF